MARGLQEISVPESTSRKNRLTFLIIESFLMSYKVQKPNCEVQGIVQPATEEASTKVVYTLLIHIILIALLISCSCWRTFQRLHSFPPATLP